jgi:hypothetical protein
MSAERSSDAAGRAGARQGAGPHLDRCVNAREPGDLLPSMSPKTASVHVTNILRMLNVGNRTEAAVVPERAVLT